MSFICIVCRELLSKSPWTNGDGDGDDSTLTLAAAPRNIPGDIVSTKCGHMYHLDCLKDWFNKQANPKQECPYCKTAVNTDSYQRIFPIGDEETDDIDAKLKNATKITQESAILKNELEQYKNVLEETGMQLQDQTLAMDILQFEYREKCLEAVAQRAEIEDIMKAKNENCRKLEKALLKSEATIITLQKKVEEERSKALKLQSDIDTLRSVQMDQEIGPTSLMRNISLNHESLLDEIRILQQNVQSGFSAGTGAVTGNFKSRHAMASQTDSSHFAKEALLSSLSRIEMHDVCIEFLRKEKAILESSQNSEKVVPVPKVKSSEFHIPKFMQDDSIISGKKVNSNGIGIACSTSNTSNPVNEIVTCTLPKAGVREQIKQQHPSKVEAGLRLFPSVRQVGVGMHEVQSQPQTIKFSTLDQNIVNPITNSSGSNSNGFNSEIIDIHEAGSPHAGMDGVNESD